MYIHTDLNMVVVVNRYWCIVHVPEKRIQETSASGPPRPWDSASGDLR